MSVSELMLQSQIDKANVAELIKLVQRQRDPKLELLVGEKHIPEVLKMLEKKDTKALIKHIGIEKIINFLRMLGADDPQHSDPEYFEYMLENTKKSMLFSELTTAFKLRVPMPTEVIWVALRSFNSKDYDTQVVWNNHNEQEYSRFSEFNLYPDMLKYIVFDTHEPDHKQYDYDYIRFLCFLLLFAQNNTPSGVLTKNRVFCADCVNDEANLSMLLTTYDEKLKKTIQLLKEKQEDSINSDQERAGKDSFVKMLETPVGVPLTIDSQFDAKTLSVEHKKLGLAKDCPADEQTYFAKQYFNVKKGLQKFLKLPRRSLITATEYIRVVNVIDGDEAMYVNSFQAEDIMDCIDDAEQKMVSTVTANIYDSARYNEAMEKARKEVNKKIETRMTRKTAFFAGLAIIAAYFLGFVPLFISNYNTAKSFSFSALATVGACIVFALIGLGCLFVLRHQLVKCFKAFNKVMNGIVMEVHSVMKRFSEYLSHACKFMRGFSAINCLKESEKTGSVLYKIFAKHIHDIKKTRAEYRALFSEIGLIKNVKFKDLEAYDFDFSQTADYEYLLPFDQESLNRVEFLQENNYVEAPVNYVRSVTLRREELFDV